VGCAGPTAHQALPCRAGPKPGYMKYVYFS
jgi:hypothetical protein